MSNLIEKPISELLDKKFFIPSYQRGYRWTEQQVKDLLNDIWEFSQKDKQKDEWYCLQPIVVLKKDGKYNVLDGQQRLTTIFLILKYLNTKNPFKIEYQTKDTSTIILESIDTKEDNYIDYVDMLPRMQEKYKEQNNEWDEEKVRKWEELNIDFFHIHQAIKTIKDRFENKGDYINKGKYSPIDKDKFKKVFCNTNDNTIVKIIWYEVSKGEDEIQIFTRLNMGKIPLTNSELIKALFLNSSNFDTKNEEEIRLRQLEIASEWDNIEYALQNDELWYFIKNEDKNKTYYTHIDYLFELIKKKENGNPNDNDEYATFRYFSEKFKDNDKNEIEKIKKIEENWKEIKQTFQTLEEWFLDKELYHKIGYLVAIGNNIVDLLKESEDKLKTEFKTFLDKQIQTSLNIEFENLHYGNREKCRNFLLLHNVHTMLQNTNSTTRFPFNKYKNESWDIEHIHAKATEVKVKSEDLKLWLENNFIDVDKNKIESEINREAYDLIKDILSDNNKPEIISDEDKEKIISFVLGDIDDDIRNLCLLDKTTNRSYKNDSFKYKRKKLIKFEKEGTFVPICTRNVFLKYYSDKLTDMNLWNEEDRIKYKEDLEKTYNFYKNTQN